MIKGSGVYYYSKDGLGSVVNLTDLNGNVIESYTYDEYGNISNGSLIGNRYLYTSREYDSETGLYYYRARYYDPSIGRFLQTDPYSGAPNDIRLLKVPIFKFQSVELDNVNNRRKIIFGKSFKQALLLNLYLYGLNNPIIFIDPNGTEVFIIGRGPFILRPPFNPNIPQLSGPRAVPRLPYKPPLPLPWYPKQPWWKDIKPPEPHFDIPKEKEDFT